MRIHVTGNAGAGKTTLAGAMGKWTGIPVYSLDRVVWEAGWKKRAPEERAALEAEWIARDEWIIEGVSGVVRRAADRVFFLDVDRFTCSARVLRRCLRFGRRTRPELPDGCPEWRIALRALGIVYQFPRLVGNDIREEARREPDRIVSFDPRRDAIEDAITLK